MAINSKLIQVKADFPITTNNIENRIKELGFVPLRWAIVKVDCETLTISLACENL